MNGLLSYYAKKKKIRILVFKIAIPKADTMVSKNKQQHVWGHVRSHKSNITK